MFYAFQIMVLETWDVWTGLFGFVPYGDPYLAIATLIALGAMVVKMVAGSDTA